MAKEIKMMILDSCPHCKRAFQMIDALKKQNPAFQEVPIDVIEESKEPERADEYDYWYVPTLFVDGKKIMEGAPSIEKIEEAFNEALG